MKLVTMQRAVARAVMQPLTPSEHMQRTAPSGGKMSAYAARFIKPNDRLTSFERLEIYNRQYWFRLLSCMNEDFPGLRAILGGPQFEKMSTAYICDCPSRSFTLRNLGAQLETWLREHPEWLQDKQALALDMVRLEWADIEAFDGQAKPALRASDLAAHANPNLRLNLQPYIQLLDLKYPVDDLLLAVRDGDDEGSDFASNAFQERKKKKKVHAVARLQPAQIFLAVHRLDFSVYFRRVSREEFHLLAALRRGRGIQPAIEMAFRTSSVPEKERASAVRHWFQTWAMLGWFCQPEKVKAAKKSAKKDVN
jgi:hypothetical protein